MSRRYTSLEEDDLFFLLHEELYERWVGERQLISRNWLMSSSNWNEILYATLRLYLRKTDILFSKNYACALLLSYLMTRYILIILIWERARNLVSTFFLVVNYRLFTSQIASMCFLLLWIEFLDVNNCSVA